MSWSRTRMLSFSQPKLRKLVKRAGFQSLAGAPEGTPVCVRGVIRAIDPTSGLLEAPLSGKRCVYYESCIDLDVAGAIAMKPHVREVRIASFALECADGVAIVDAAHGEVSARFDHETTSGAAFDAEPRQRALLDTRPVESWFEVSTVIYYEAILELDQEIALLGAGTRELDPASAAAYREAGTRMHFAGTVKHPLVIIDHPDQS